MLVPGRQMAKTHLSRELLHLQGHPHLCPWQLGRRAARQPCPALRCPRHPLQMPLLVNRTYVPNNSPPCQHFHLSPELSTSPVLPCPFMGHSPKLWVNPTPGRQPSPGCPAVSPRKGGRRLELYTAQPGTGVWLQIMVIWLHISLIKCIKCFMMKHSNVYEEKTVSSWGCCSRKPLTWLGFINTTPYLQTSSKACKEKWAYLCQRHVYILMSIVKLHEK